MTEDQVGGVCGLACLAIVVVGLMVIHGVVERWWGAEAASLCKGAAFIFFGVLGLWALSVDGGKKK